MNFGSSGPRIGSAVAGAQAGANADITSLSGLTTPLSVPQGGQGAANVTAITNTYAILTTDLAVNATSGTFTATLPTAVGLTGRVFQIKNSGTGTVTVATTSSQTIDGAATVDLAQYENLTVQSNNANWIIL